MPSHSTKPKKNNIKNLKGKKEKGTGSSALADWDSSGQWERVGNNGIWFGSRQRTWERNAARENHKKLTGKQPV